MPRHYILGSLKNAARDLIRKRNRREAIDRRLHQGQSWVDEGSPDKLCAHKQVVDRLRQLMDQLPEEQRKVVELMKFEELSQVEAAKRLGISTQRVRQQLKRALLFLQSGLDGGGKCT